MYKNVALTGTSGVGKDYIADLLVKSYRFQKLSFIEPLRRCLYEKFGVPFHPYNIDKTFEHNHKFNGYTIQELLIKANEYLGADGKLIMRTIMRIKINYFNEDDFTPVVISNLRFPAELEFLRDFDVYRVVGNAVRGIQEFDTLLDDYNFKVVGNYKPNTPKEILSQLDFNESTQSYYRTFSWDEHDELLNNLSNRIMEWDIIS